MKKASLLAIVAAGLLVTVANAEDSMQFHWAKTAADRGDVGAMVQVGNDYLGGSGVGQDYNQAFRYFRAAAERGNPEAVRTVGQSYMNGWGVPVDLREAERWLRRAASMGEPRANELLQNVHQKLGEGSITDSAPQFGGGAAPAPGFGGGVNPAPGMVGPGPMAGGFGGPSPEVRELFREAQQGNPQAMYDLGMRLITGNGIPTDVDHAFQWMQNAAHSHNAQAMNELARMYERGLGTPMNHQAAEYWRNQARQYGYHGRY